ncbi:hypothetical protein JW979_09265, partial [bacterium]|nr:hypothetical protein [candidate division CSSED10-310 bacterium]
NRKKGARFPHPLIASGGSIAGMLFQVEFILYLIEFLLQSFVFCFEFFYKVPIIFERKYALRKFSSWDLRAK